MPNAPVKLLAPVIAGFVAFGANPELLEGAERRPPCPSPERVAKISPRCGHFLIRTLMRNGFNDSDVPMAVLTYQKFDPDLDNDGILGPLTARSILRRVALDQPSPMPRSKGRIALVDKSRQVMYRLQNGKIKGIHSISSGTEKPYSEVGSDGLLHSGIGDTPTGIFKVSARIYGKYYRSPLGPMAFAHFYDDRRGFAIHAGYVDSNGRDSHGCVRVNPLSMEYQVAPWLRKGDKVIIRAKIHTAKN